MPKNANILTTLREIYLFIDSMKDIFPSFETRMINRERRFRLRYAEGKITEERLVIELKAIAQRREARAGR